MKKFIGNMINKLFDLVMGDHEEQRKKYYFRQGVGTFHDTEVVRYTYLETYDELYDLFNDNAEQITEQEYLENV